MNANKDNEDNGKNNKLNRITSSCGGIKYQVLRMEIFSCKTLTARVQHLKFLGETVPLKRIYHATVNIISQLGMLIQNHWADYFKNKCSCVGSSNFIITNALFLPSSFLFQERWARITLHRHFLLLPKTLRNSRSFGVS